MQKPALDPGVADTAPTDPASVPWFIMNERATLALFVFLSALSVVLVALAVFAM